MDLLTKNETTVHGLDKVEHFGWTIDDAPGQLTWLNKTDLLVDHSYQRNAKHSRVIKIAQAWSWISCGVIIVAKRFVGKNWQHFVVDGQHRVLAALKRSDIELLPCLVFHTKSAVEEAVGFYDANTNRRMPTSIEKWRAMLMARDEHAMLVDSLIESSGRVVGGVSGASSVRCLSAMLQASRTDRDCLHRVWPVVSAVCRGQALHERVFMGLFYIERNLPAGQSLSEKRWQDRVIRTGYEGLLSAANRAAGFFGKGSSKTYATGMLEQLNKGCRVHIALRDQV